MEGKTALDSLKNCDLPKDTDAIILDLGSIRLRRGSRNRAGHVEHQSAR